EGRAAAVQADARAKRRFLLGHPSIANLTVLQAIKGGRAQRGFVEGLVTRTNGVAPLLKITRDDINDEVKRRKKKKKKEAESREIGYLVKRRKAARAQLEADKVSKKESKLRQLATNDRDVKKRMAKLGNKYKPTVSDLKVLVGFKKKKGDDAMPKQPKKKDWLDRYNKTKGRPTPNVSLAESDEDDVSQLEGVALEAAEASTEESTNDDGEVVIRRTRRHEHVDLCQDSDGDGSDDGRRRRGRRRRRRRLRGVASGPNRTSPGASRGQYRAETSAATAKSPQNRYVEITHSTPRGIAPQPASLLENLDADSKSRAQGLSFAPPVGAVRRAEHAA
ncbi:hypothetical protein THAOC_15718, partial [Thalassiosira oceanica]